MAWLTLLLQMEGLPPRPQHRVWELAVEPVGCPMQVRKPIIHLPLWNGVPFTPPNLGFYAGFGLLMISGFPALLSGILETVVLPTFLVSSHMGEGFTHAGRLHHHMPEGKGFTYEGFTIQLASIFCK